MFTRSQVNSQMILNWPAIMEEHCRNARDARLKHFYKSSIVDQTRPLAQVPFVALDFETTGLDPNADDIISIGLVPFDLQRIYCQSASHWLVNPRQPMEADSVVIHGITHTDIIDAPDLQRILDEVLIALTGKMIVVHYNRIEREFLNNALKIRLGEGIQFPVIDTMAIEASVQRRPVKGIWNRLRKGQRPISVRLINSRERYGLPPHQAHHALSDAIATAELFQAQVAHHYSHKTTLSDIWV